MPLEHLDISELINSDEMVVELLTQILREGDTELLLAALAKIAKAKGMTTLARQSGMSRESLYKALRPGSSPRFATILRILRGLGINLVAAAA